MSARDTYIEQDGFGLIPRPRGSGEISSFDIVKRYTMTNKHGSTVSLISWGAGIQSIRVPNQKGFLGDVVLGFDNMDGYLENRYMGSMIGRIVNRVSEARMCVEDKLFFLSANDEYGDNHYNGGFVGFDNVNWESCIRDKQVVMSHLSYAGNEGYPGHMLTQVKFAWTDENQLHINIRATATQPTPANITNNCLMNLAGHGMGVNELRKHVVTINADSWTFMDVRDNLPTGVIRPVLGTVYDLRVPTQMTRQQLYSVPGGGYNHNLCVSSPSCWCYRFHARILHPESGRFLEVYSNHPGLQFNTGNDLPDPDFVLPPDFEDYACCGCGDGRVPMDLMQIRKKTMKMYGKGGLEYRRHGGFVLSPQNYPDAINIDHFPSCILYPGKVYLHDLTYKFGVVKGK